MNFKRDSSGGNNVAGKESATDQSPKLGQLESVTEVSKETSNTNEAKEGEDLFGKIKWFIVIGKILGVLPFSGVFQKSYLNLSVTCYSGSSIASMILIFFLGLNFMLECFQATQVSKGNAVELAVAVKAPIYYGYGVFIYLYFFIQSRKLMGLFHYWVKTRTFYFASDLHLSRHIGLMALVILTSAFLENAVLQLKYFTAFDNLNDIILMGYNERPGGGLQTKTSVLEVYYRRSHYDWSNVLGYSEIYAVLIFIANKITLYSWNYADLFLCVCGRALYFRFKTLYEKSRMKLITTDYDKTGLDFVKPFTCREDWTNIVRDHNSLCILLKEFETVLSPLIFFSYVTNVFYICMQIYMGLHSEDSGPGSIIQTIYGPWSLIQLGLRMYLVSINLAKVNVYAHRIMEIIQECPLEYYDKNMSRFDRSITCGRKFGFSGLGCFLVSMPFILRVIGVIFTFEIVLLQGSSTDESKCCCDSTKTA